MNKKVTKELLPQEVIMKKIFVFRGQKVMLDRDLAELYEVKTIRLREQVKRNKTRFPQDFMFQLNEGEVNLMVSQNAIPSKQSLGGHFPYVFTEHGILMLSSVLNTERAVQTNIKIMRVFVKLKEMIIKNKDLELMIEKIIKKVNTHNFKLKEHDDKIAILSELIEQILSVPAKPKQKIGFTL